MKNQKTPIHSAEDRWINTADAKKLVGVKSDNGLYKFLERNHIRASKPKGCKINRYDKYEILDVFERNSFRMGE
jgi:hypothetical protein